MSMTNSLVFWDSKGNTLMSITSFEDDINSEDLLELDEVIKNFLKSKNYIVDNSSEECLKVEEDNA